MTITELRERLLSICPSGQIEWNNNNQIVFYTNLTDEEDGTLKEIEQ